MIINNYYIFKKYTYELLPTAFIPYREGHDDSLFFEDIQLFMFLNFYTFHKFKIIIIFLTLFHIFAFFISFSYLHCF